MISTQNLLDLPSIAIIKNTSKAIAVLDAIISPEWEYRYYSYNAQWDEDTKEETASMRDGEGDEYIILFTPKGAIINGFAINSEMNGWQDDNTQIIWKGIFDDIPVDFLHFIQTEPVPSIGTTFCVWRNETDVKWKMSNIDLPHDDYKDGSEILTILDGNPKTYQIFAQEYYETTIDIFLINYVYNNGKITKEFVKKINPNFQDWEILKIDLEEINFPHDLT